MKTALAAALLSLCLAAPALAQDMKKKEEAAPPAAGGMDMSKMGPWTRKADEKKVKKEIDAFFKEQDALHKKGDFEAMLATHDFPVFMLTDSAQGVPHGDTWTREQWVQMMKPMMENMPKDMKMTHKPTVTVLSDALVAVTDDFTMTMGKQKFSGRNAGLLVKKDGQWKWKAMVEAGWGDMPQPAAGTGGAGQEIHAPKK